jgi:hypothetical protein
VAAIPGGRTLNEPGSEDLFFSTVERWGSCIAHGGTLFIGIPLTFFLHEFPLFLAPCPLVAYMISRSFRRRRMAWGAFQGMQAAVVQFVILLLAVGMDNTGAAPNLALVFGLAGFLIFLYSLWGALDTLLGFDFRYFYIGDLLNKVSQANLNRTERKRGWFGFGGSDKSGRDR